MDGLWGEVLNGIANGLGKQAAVTGVAIASGGVNAWFLFNAVTRPGKAKATISEELDQVVPAVLQAYGCMENDERLSNPTAIEDAARRVSDRLGFLATMADMKHNESDYKNLQVAIDCTESLRLFGGFVRNFCAGNSNVQKPGIRYHGWLQHSAKEIEDIAGVPEAIDTIRKIIRKKRRDKFGLKEARDAAIPVVAKKLELSKDGMFLSSK